MFRAKCFTLTMAVLFCTASHVASQSNSTEMGFVRLLIDPWVNRRIYAPVTVPTGTSVQFVWNGAHGVYLLDSAQCPTMYAAGPNMLYPVSAASSMNNNYTATLTSPGVYYFSCPVTGHCPSGQLQTITVFDPMPGNATGLVAAM